ncbi:MAG: hypothetical protein IBX57_00420 [Gammaproteobacteria bacterium]|nr:hypothetical protein [Gammaproteobacteria bacterium]
MLVKDIYSILEQHLPKTAQSMLELIVKGAEDKRNYKLVKHKDPGMYIDPEGKHKLVCEVWIPKTMDEIDMERISAMMRISGFHEVIWQYKSDGQYIVLTVHSSNNYVAS